MRTLPSGVVELIHGVEVKDPYRWLEDRQLPETEGWLLRQKRICDGYFQQNRLYNSLQEIIRDALSVEVIDQAARVGSYLFLRKQGKGEEQASIRVLKANGGAERVLVDPSALGPAASIEILRISSDASLMAYSVRYRGTDAMEVHVVDVESGNFLLDHLPLAYGRGFMFDTKNLGFYYSMEPVHHTDTLAIQYHRFGTGPSEDATLFSVPWASHRRLLLLQDTSTIGALVTDSFGEEMVQDLSVADQSEPHSWKSIYEGLQKQLVPLIVRGRIFLIDREDSRTERILEFSEGTEPYPVTVPERPNHIQRVAIIEGKFLISYLAVGRTHLEEWSLEGKLIRAHQLPTEGSVEIFPALSVKGSSVFFLHETYTEAPNLWEIRLIGSMHAEPVPLSDAKESISATVRVCLYPSSDGTRIPMTLIGPKADCISGVRPIVLMGYGGFGIAERPRFSRFIKIMVGLGVTIARPGIRGGSEFGKEWHGTAMGRDRQTVIDDFLAAMEWLHSETLVDARHLAIMGSSNGGLLVAAAAMQRPDLFQAVVSTGPLTDMVRYERFDRAAKWRSEYGSAESPEDFQTLLSYSPYHHVKNTTDYPAMLVVSGDADDRCNPAHARKFVAVIQDREAQKRLILLDYGEDWGHVPTLSLAERVKSLGRKIAFLCEQLNTSIDGDVDHDVFDS